MFEMSFYISKFLENNLSQFYKDYCLLVYDYLSIMILKNKLFFVIKQTSISLANINSFINSQLDMYTHPTCWSVCLGHINLYYYLMFLGGIPPVLTTSVCYCYYMDSPFSFVIIGFSHKIHLQEIIIVIWPHIDF